MIYSSRAYQLHLTASDNVSVRTAPDLTLDDETQCADNIALLVKAARQLTMYETGGSDLMLLAAWLVHHLGREWLREYATGLSADSPADVALKAAAKALEDAATAYIRACKAV